MTSGRIRSSVVVAALATAITGGLGPGVDTAFVHIGQDVDPWTTTHITRVVVTGSSSLLVL